MIDLLFFFVDDEQRPAETAGDGAGSSPYNSSMSISPNNTSYRVARIGDTMDLDTQSQPAEEASKKISTHGPRGSRREQWRESKGMTARPQRKGTNRQGGLAARRKAGRSHRRR